MKEKSLNFGMASVAIIVLVFAALLIRGRLADSTPGNSKPLTPEQRQERDAASAQTMLQSAITNDVVGYTRTIKLDDFIFTGTPVSNWWASATVEFVNQVGGVERTTLYYRFKTSFGDVRIRPVTAEEFVSSLSAQ